MCAQTSKGGLGVDNSFRLNVGIVPETRPAPSTRPADRRERILDAAATLFHRRGYRRVSLDDIATAVSISAPALYRHFPGKQALLQAVVDTCLDGLERVVAASNSLAHLSSALADFTASNDHFGVLLIREVECLGDAQKIRARARYDQIVASIAASIEAERPMLASEVTVVLARAALAIATSASNNPSASGTVALRQLVARGVLFVCSDLDTEVRDLVPSVARPHPGSRAQPWLSRSEAILSAAPWLLTTNGALDPTTLEDIGAAVGISGTGVYTYFSSKADLFLAVAMRSMRWASTELEKSMAMSTSGPDVMFRALESSIGLADWFSGALLDLESLPLSPSQRTLLMQTTDEYLALWLECLRAARSDLDFTQQGIILTACSGVVAELAIRSHGVALRPDDSEVARMTLALLLAV